MYRLGLVSVIIPAYNHENYVQGTIKSIIEQTYQNIELIVIDDGSKDSTWQKIQELQVECEKRFVRVVFETKENEGSCETLNKLLSLAQGEFVYIIASDDLAKPNAIEKEVEFLVQNKDYALCVGDNEIIDSEGKKAYWDRKRNLVYNKNEARYLTFAHFLKTRRKDVDFSSDEFGKYGNLLHENYVPNGYLIRKSIFEKVGKFTHKAPLEDWWLMLQISKYARMKYLDEVLFSYRWHEANTIKNVEKIREYLQKTRAYEKDVFKKMVLDNCQQSFKDYLRSGYCYKKVGISYFFELCRYEKFEQRWRILKIFNIPIFNWEKS